MGSISGLGRSPGEGNGNPLQGSCLKNPMDRGAWQTTVHGVAESDTTEHTYHTYTPKAQALVNLGGHIHSDYALPSPWQKRRGLLSAGGFRKAKEISSWGSATPTRQTPSERGLIQQRVFFCLFFARGISRPVLRLVGVTGAGGNNFKMWWTRRLRESFRGCLFFWGGAPHWL